MQQRPDKTEYYLNIAREVSRRSTCLRRRFGAVIVRDDQIISTGYVGAPRGTPNWAIKRSKTVATGTLPCSVSRYLTGTPRREID